DTTLDGYVRSLSDSTDVLFGPVAAPVDTTGLDSARVWALEHPYRWQHVGKHRVSLAPWLNFNRVDGPVLGGTVSVGDPERWGRLEGRLAEATGPNRTLGGASYAGRRERGETRWSFELSGGRSTTTMDRERSDARLAAIRAFLNGADRKQYLQRDG